MIFIQANASSLRQKNIINKKQARFRIAKKLERRGFWPRLRHYTLKIIIPPLYALNKRSPSSIYLIFRGPRLL
jgi:hypothetical protein